MDFNRETLLDCFLDTLDNGPTKLRAPPCCPTCKKDTYGECGHCTYEDGYYDLKVCDGCGKCGDHLTGECDKEPPVAHLPLRVYEEALKRKKRFKRIKRKSTGSILSKPKMEVRDCGSISSTIKFGDGFEIPRELWECDYI